MIRESVDVLVIGSGFAGSLTALLMQRFGRSVALIDKDRHPRFAIGESSTPLADLFLRSIAERYDLPQFLPLCDYGPWKETYPDIVCGEKRGFSYFLHHPDEPFQADAAHSTELLVTANKSRRTADTHWLRCDVDQFFARQAADAGVLSIEGAALEATARDPWRWEGTADDERIDIHARFVIDATGPAGVVARAAGAEAETSGFQTESWCLYAHVESLEPWGAALQRLGVDCADHPFPADEAAVHHLLEEGWMWQLPFDNGVTSIGIVLDGGHPSMGADVLWQRALARYPTIAEQFREARIVAPAGGLVSTPRLQRRWNRMVGPDWVLLPATAGFIDPLHSTGIAHSLSGVERLIDLTSRYWGTAEFLDRLRLYEVRLNAEFDLIDHLVAACYATRHDFRSFTAATMLYFVAAISCEERRLDGEQPGFLATDDDRLDHTLIQSARRLIALRGRPPHECEPIVNEVRRAIEPWNSAGLLSPAIPNMYEHTGR